MSSLKWKKINSQLIEIINTFMNYITFAIEKFGVCLKKIERRFLSGVIVVITVSGLHSQEYGIATSKYYQSDQKYSNRRNLETSDCNVKCI